MQFRTTIFESKKQTVDGATFQILVVEQQITAVCDVCSFALTGTEEEIKKDFLIVENLTLCGNCSY